MAAGRNLDRSKLAGLYVPTITPLTNLTTLVANRAWFSLNGICVSVWAHLNVDPIASGIWTARMTLPPEFDRSFAVVQDLAGICSPGDAGFSGRIEADVATGEALIQADNGGATQTGGALCFSYLIEV